MVLSNWLTVTPPLPLYAILIDVPSSMYLGRERMLLLRHVLNVVSIDVRTFKDARVIVVINLLASIAGHIRMMGGNYAWSVKKET